MHGTLYVRMLPPYPKRLDSSPAATVANGRQQAQRALREQAHIDAKKKCLAQTVVTKQFAVCVQPASTRPRNSGNGWVGRRNDATMQRELSIHPSSYTIHSTKNPSINFICTLMARSIHQPCISQQTSRVVSPSLRHPYTFFPSSSCQTQRQASR